MHSITDNARHDPKGCAGRLLFESHILTNFRLSYII
jgi:hypothetical protein